MLLGTRMGGLEPEMYTYMSGLNTPLSGLQKNLINILIKDLKQAVGVNKLSDAFDIVKLYANETIEAGLKNIAKNAHHSTLVNSPTFVQFNGFMGNGINSYIDSNYNPAVNRVNLSLNSGSYGIYFKVLQRTINPRYNGTYDLESEGGLSNRIIVGTNSGNQNFISINSGAVAITDSTSPAILIGSRTSVNYTHRYINRTNIPSSSISTKIPNNKMCTLANMGENGIPHLFGMHLASFEFIGKGFSEIQINGIIDAIEKYMDYRGNGIL